jgi:hypothetical protein
MLREPFAERTHPEQGSPVLIDDDGGHHEESLLRAVCEVPDAGRVCRIRFHDPA